MQASNASLVLCSRFLTRSDAIEAFPRQSLQRDPSPPSLGFRYLASGDFILPPLNDQHVAMGWWFLIFHSYEPAEKNIPAHVVCRLIRFLRKALCRSEGRRAPGTAEIRLSPSGIFLCALLLPLPPAQTVGWKAISRKFTLLHLFLKLNMLFRKLWPSLILAFGDQTQFSVGVFTFSLMIHKIRICDISFSNFIV